MRAQLSQEQSTEDCPGGFLWYSCSTNIFTGCCSINPCAEGVTCPDINTTPTLTPALAATPSATNSPNTTSSIPIMSSEVTPTVVISVGVPLSTSPPSTAPASSGHASSSRSSDISSHHAPSETTFTVYLSKTPDGGTALASVPLPTALSPLSTQSATPAAAINGNNSINNNSYPMGLITAIVTGFSILILVMGIMFCVLWRHKRIKVVGDDEVAEIRSRRGGMRAYYMPRPPNNPEAQKMLGGGGCGGGGDPDESPTKSVRGSAPPEVVTPRRVAAGSLATSTPGSSSVVTNRAWPPVSLATVYGASESPFRQEGYVNGGEFFGLGGTYLSYSFPFPHFAWNLPPHSIPPRSLRLNTHTAHAIDHPDPLRANEPNSYHAWPLVPSMADPVVSPMQDAFFSPLKNKEPRTVASTSHSNSNYGSDQVSVTIHATTIPIPHPAQASKRPT